MPEVTFERNNNEYQITIFVLEDPCLKVYSRNFGNSIILDIEYKFDTELLYAFSYETIISEDGTRKRRYFAHYLNRKNSKEEIEVDHDLANLRLADKEFIYNGSYYKAIAA